jgi:hypothetical protein
MNGKRKMIGVGVAIVAFGTVTLPQLASAGHTNTVLEATLRGRNEVASGSSSQRLVGDPDGRGEIYVSGVDGDPTTLCYVLTVSKIDTARAAHIHKGPKGSNGPVVVNLAAPGDGNAADCLTEGEPGKFATVNGVPLATVADILANPDDYYVNVHNDAYPGGAIRGQLTGQH